MIARWRRASLFKRAFWATAVIAAIIGLWSAWRAHLSTRAAPSAVVAGACDPVPAGLGPELTQLAGTLQELACAVSQLVLLVGPLINVLAGINAWLADLNAIFTAIVRVALSAALLGVVAGLIAIVWSFWADRFRVHQKFTDEGIWRAQRGSERLSRWGNLAPAEPEHFIAFVNGTKHVVHLVESVEVPGREPVELPITVDLDAVHDDTLREGVRAHLALHEKQMKRSSSKKAAAKHSD